MTTPTQSPELDNALIDPVFWSDVDRVHDLLTWLRSNDPLRFVQRR